MARTLLNGVNDVLKKVRVLDSDAGLLTSLTDSAKQTFIDSAVQSINEVMDELYSITEISKPKQMREATITLVNGTKDYSLHSSLLWLRREYHLIDETNSHIIAILGENGYWQIIQGDIDQDDTGLPSTCAISPVNDRLYFDRAPTSVEAGRVYKYRYDRDLELDEATDCFPFNNAVYRALVPAAAEVWKMYQQQEFIQGVFNASLSRAARYLRRQPPDNSWSPRQPQPNPTDPMNAA